MMDLSHLLDLPRAALVVVLRTFWWLAWCFCVETVGWSIGWLALRAVSLGQFPREPLPGVDDAGRARALFVEAVGLATLATAAWMLSGEWPPR